MIVEWLMDIGIGMLSTILGWFPPIGLEDFILAVGAFGDLALGAGSLGIWVDWVFVGGTVAVVLGLFAALTIAKAVLRFLGHIPVIGGHW